MTTGSGLYRYRTGDLVEVGTDGRAIRFIGRTGNVSDLVGEKLSEAQVTRAFAKAGARGWIEAHRSGYSIYLEGGSREILVQCLCEKSLLVASPTVGTTDSV